eukprot:2448202-Amphidinium_carterae.2
MRKPFVRADKSAWICCNLDACDKRACALDSGQGLHDACNARSDWSTDLLQNRDFLIIWLVPTAVFFVTMVLWSRFRHVHSSERRCGTTYPLGQIQVYQVCTNLQLQTQSALH